MFAARIYGKLLLQSLDPPQSRAVIAIYESQNCSNLLLLNFFFPKTVSHFLEKCSVLLDTRTATCHETKGLSAEVFKCDVFLD